MELQLYFSYALYDFLYSFQYDDISKLMQNAVVCKCWIYQFANMFPIMIVKIQNRCELIIEYH